MFDRSCVSRFGMRDSLWSHVSFSYNNFSLQRALHAGIFEAVVFFFDVQEESLGSARDLAF